MGIQPIWIVLRKTFQCANRDLIMSGFALQHGGLVSRHGVGGVQLKSAIEVGLRLIQLTALCKNAAEVEVGLEVVGVDPKRLPERCLRLLFVPGSVPCPAGEGLDSRKFWVEAECCVEVLA